MWKYKLSYSAIIRTFLSRSYFLQSCFHKIRGRYKRPSDSPWYVDPYGHKDTEIRGALWI